MRNPEPSADEEKVMSIAQDFVRSIRYARVTFYTIGDKEIITTGPYKCHPGDTLSVEVPSPETLEFSSSPEG